MHQSELIINKRNERDIIEKKRKLSYYFISENIHVYSCDFNQRIGD